MGPVIKQDLNIKATKLFLKNFKVLISALIITEIQGQDMLQDFGSDFNHVWLIDYSASFIASQLSA